MSELFEKRAAKDGLITPKIAAKAALDKAMSGEAELVITIVSTVDGDIEINWSSGDPLAYIGLLKVAENDLLVEILEGLNRE